ncbi:hypothetical protein NE236_17430 [Actinoallomurus purpureus]|uniref:WD40 repeat domain-containing protein n=1 Tax=Actinoallomurus purpureus TaxID=478114 RepID=UPI002093CA5B|nr:hypothetical protein [Actinoallomurus purpureus]MCO6006770.1 hypothetical protein [Actinoallomurus purpureus]
MSLVAALSPPTAGFGDTTDQDLAKAVAFSPDGRTLAVGYDSGTVRLWDVGSRNEVRTFQGSWMIVCLAFSPDGRTLTCGSGADTRPPTHLWDLATGHRTDLPGSGWVTFSPDGRLLAVASGDNRLWLWEMAHRRRIATLRVADRTDFAAFSPDGTTLACGGGEDDQLTMQLWRVPDRTRSHTFVIPHSRQGESAQVVGLSFDPAGRPLAIDDGGGIWDIAAGERSTSLSAVPGAGSFPGWGVAGLSPDGRTVVATSGQDVQWVDLVTGKEIAPPYRSDSYIHGWQVAFTRDSTLAAVLAGPQTLLYRLHQRR